jgi:chitinase
MKHITLMTIPLLAASMWVNVHATDATKPPSAKAATALTPAKADAPGAQKEKKVLMGYYPNWSHYAGYTADKIPFKYMTHLLYAFYITDNSGNLANSDPNDADNFKDVIRLGHEAGVKILLSIGGAGQSEGFKAVASSSSARANFIKNALKLCDQFGLDGIDIDWEFPTEGEGDAQLKLHQEIRAAFDKQPRKILFTAAVPATNWFGQWSKDETFKQLDFLNCMTYDYMGTWEKTVIPNSGMDQSKATLDYYDSRGIPHSKLVLGAAFYGKSFDGGTSMGSAFQGKGSGNDGLLDWKDLLAQFEAVPYKIRWDEKTQSEYAVGNEEIIVFNGIPSTRARGEYVRNSDYAGVMLWDLLGDVQDPKKSLLVALYRGLRGTNKSGMALPSSTP